MLRRCLVLAVLAAVSSPADEPPKEARRAFEKGQSALKARRTDEAVHDFEQAVTLYPAYAEAWYTLGKLKLTRNDQEGARKACDAAIRADSGYAPPYQLLITLEQSAGHWKELVDLTYRFLKVDGVDYPQTWLLNAVGNYNLHNFEAAEKSAREAERLDTQQRFPEAWHIMGLILERRGDFAGEAEQLRTFLKLAPSGNNADAARAHLEEAEKRGAIAPAGAEGLTFRTETRLAVVRFQVLAAKGSMVREIGAEDIEVREDGVPQKIAVFEGGRTTSRTFPIEVSLLFDCSGSVERVAAMSARVFREGILDEFPNVSLAVYGFSDNLQRFTRPTRDPVALKKALDAVGAIPKRDTPLFGSIADTIRDASATGANVVRMLVVLSDGESAWPGDDSRVEDVKNAARESGTAVFPVILDKPGGTPPAAVGSVFEFLELAGATGGKQIKGFMGTDVLPAVLKSVAIEIRSDYLAGFYVPAEGGRKRHDVQVVLRSKDKGRVYGGSRTIVY